MTTREAVGVAASRAAEGPDLDARNAAFWDELCGSSLARALGITDATPDSLRRFDAAYMGFYPYLWDYVTREDLRGKRVLEIGLGYGTLSQILAGRAGSYCGADIAPGPVAMVRSRVGWARRNGRALRGSALELPYRDATFDYVYSIGCLHHTGDVPRAIDEVWRVLRPGGKAIVMLYYRYSFRQIAQVPLVKLREWLAARKTRDAGAAVRALYDANASGEAAPYTTYVSRREARRLFRRFGSVRMELRNFDTYRIGARFVIPRERLLGTLARVAGLDLYLVATR